MKLLTGKPIGLIMGFCLIFAMILCSVGFQQLLTYAYEEQTGMIVTDASMVETKETASDSAARVSGLVYGKPVTVINEVTGDDGLQWYQITYKLKANNSVTKTAYVHTYNVLLDKDATVVANATINSNEIGLRDDAGTDGTVVLKTLHQGDKVQILDQTSVGSNLWYRVSYTVEETMTIGWVLGTYVTIDEYVYEPDLDFEDQMRALGFPESYINPLSALHAKYPNWQFVPVITELDWNDVIANESLPVRNLVSITADDAKKSVAESEYDWETNTWVPRDTGKWVTVHPDYLAYCMDPRNFINEANIFMFEALSYSETHSLEGVNAILKGTFMTDDIIDADGTTLNYANAFMTIGQNVNVSPYHLASRIRQEQGVYGDSVLISGTYPGFEGYYNYFNIGASGNTLEEVIFNGLTEAKTEGWTTRYLALLGGSTKVSKNYISVGQDTLYFQKFNVVYKDKLYWHQYMQNVTAAISEGKSVAKAYTDKTQPFVFRIPVYENMPEEAVQFTATGNRNNYLKDLSVSGLSLTPTFTGANTNYTIVVENGVSSITVTAEPVVDKATVTGTGTYDLQVGSNTIKIYCKSESGDTRAYTLTVSRQEPGEEDTSSYTWTSEKYNINGTYVTGITPGTSAVEFLSGLTGSNCTIKLLKADSSENDGMVATGNKVAIYVNNTLVETKEVVIYGDANGDGAIDILDLIKVNRHSIGAAALKGVYLEAGDANRKQDGADILDIILINRHSLGLTTIAQ